MNQQEKILVKVIDLTLEGGTFYSGLESDRGLICCNVQGSTVAMALFEWQPVWRTQFFTDTVHPQKNLEAGEVMKEIKALWPLCVWTLTQRGEEKDELFSARTDA